MSNFNTVREIRKLTRNHRIVYRINGAPEAVEMGLYRDDDGSIRTMTGDTLRTPGRDIHSDWVDAPYRFIIEDVIYEEPKLASYDGMLLWDETEPMLWVRYKGTSKSDNVWTSNMYGLATEKQIAKRFAAGELTIFTPEAPSE